MNKKKAESIIYTVCQYIDGRPPADMESLIGHVTRIAEAKCEHATAFAMSPTENPEQPKYYCPDCLKLLKSNSYKDTCKCMRRRALRPGLKE
jgi:hypothetical protein